jgi:hypothetical protein
MSIDRSPTEGRWWPWLVLMAGLALAVVLLAVPAARHFRETPAPPPQATLPADAELGSPGTPLD